MQHIGEPTAPWSLTRKIFFRDLSSNLGFFNFIWTPPATGLLNDRIRNLQLCQKIYIEKNNTLSIRNRDMELSYYSSKTDTVKQLLSYWTNTTDSVQLHYQHAGKDSMSLHGIIGKDSIHLQLKRKDPNDYLLINRGFHWINENPMNR